MSLPSPNPNGTCLVTGASSGIGADIARELAKRGLGLTLVARRGERLRTLADRLSTEYDIRAEVHPTDLTDPDARAGLVSFVEERGLVVDVLVNNAGLSTMGPISRSQRDGELAMIRTNVEAVVDLCAMIAPGMTTRRRGAILNTASTAAFQPLPGQAGYGATKAFVLSYSHAIREELSPYGITVTALCPGPVATGFSEAAGVSDEEASKSLPKFMWLESAEVARQGVDALDRGRAVVIPGAANRLGALGGHLAPTKLMTKLVARQHPALRSNT